MRQGVLGHYYGGMLDVYSDLTRLAAVSGMHLEMVEMGEPESLREQVRTADIRLKIAGFRWEFEVSPECDGCSLSVEMSVRVGPVTLRFAVAVREFIEAWSGAGPAHHYAIGVGCGAGVLRKLADLLGMPAEVVGRRASTGAP